MRSLAECRRRTSTLSRQRAHLFKIVPVVLIIITIMLMVSLRAVVAPLLLIGANILSFASAIGISAILFNWVLTTRARMPQFLSTDLSSSWRWESITPSSSWHEYVKRRTRSAPARGFCAASQLRAASSRRPNRPRSDVRGARGHPLLFMVQLAIIVPWTAHRHVHRSHRAHRGPRPRHWRSGLVAAQDRT